MLYSSWEKNESESWSELGAEEERTTQASNQKYIRGKVRNEGGERIWDGAESVFQLNRIDFLT